ncbi:hypothetical protein Q0F98_26270 [Paenibacillus amylolyticus]|uniref:hypothetical protein n=1 Tax=Paenibacillus TaxID=44249 RepID=UPI0003766524|nr:hypothetical protein [Paenibacillus sp. PAMC 26794]WKL00518.1 hypothetical protein Q0F98_26270 [Paenibacillus amylolyticus]
MLENLSSYQTYIAFLTPVLIVIISGTLLLLTNKHERVLLSPRKNLYRIIVKISALSAIGTVIALFFILLGDTFLSDSTFKFTLPYILFVFVVYFVVMSFFNGWIEKREAIYHWVYLEKYNYEPLMIHKVTFNNKLMLTSVPSLTDDIHEVGHIVVEDISILYDVKVHFIGPKVYRKIIFKRPKLSDVINAIQDKNPHKTDE